jgi:phosphohistidine swiveling domain-containing protein
MAGAMQSHHDADVNRTWLPDASHYPEQMTPLSASVWFEAIGLGLHEAMRRLHGPFGGFLTRTELGWAYESNLDPEWEIDVERVREAALGLGIAWEQEIQPRVRAITEDLHRMRPELAAPGEAVELLDRMWALVREQWVWHFLTVIPAQFAVEMLRERYLEREGDSGDPFAAYRLLEGIRTERTEADGTLRELAGQAHELGIDDIISEFPSVLVIDRLRQTQHGRVWLQSLDAYLHRFGGRSRWHELSLPREVEFPVMTLESVRLFLAQTPTSVLPAQSSHSRDDALASSPELAEAVQVATVGYRLKEDHTYSIDYPGLLATREVLLGFGRRLLAEGRIEQLEDVWMITRDELRAATEDEAVLSLTDLVQARREEIVRGREEGVRLYLGAPPPEIERHAVLEQFYGSAGDESSDTLFQGIAASPGTVEGRARIVSGSEDFRRVQPGDVLVTTTTTPAWTPLFPSLAGLVTETGGVLSHAAVVAREYRLPAVVGVEGATRRIPDGARVRVDGAAGQVELLHPGATAADLEAVHGEGD